MPVIPARAALLLRVGAPALLAGALALLAGCSQPAPDRTLEVTATDTGCEPAAPQVQAGVIRFRMTNKGSTVNELYVLDGDGRTLGEKEDIGPGTAGALTVELKAGEYRLRCRPGQKGDGIVSPITVTG